MNPRVDYVVTVCAACLTASCWHGEFMCQRAANASVTTRLASELRALGREHSDHFSRESIREISGCYPRGIR